MHDAPPPPPAHLDAAAHERWPDGVDRGVVQPSGFAVAVPDWVAEELADVPAVLPSVDDRMHLVHRMAARNVLEASGGPFAAVVCEAETGRVVSVGVNLVLATGLTGMHAEGVAIALAQRALGRWDLGDPTGPRLQMVVNGRPCIMCSGSVLWSGIRGLVTSIEGAEIEALTGFDEGPVTPDWEAEFTRRRIRVEKDVLADESRALYAWYREVADAGRAVVYNARGQSAAGRSDVVGLAD